MMNNGQLTNAVEALLFAAAKPLPARAMCRVLKGSRTEEIRNALAALNERYTQSGGSFRVREIAGGFQLYTLPEFSCYVEALLARTKTQRLSPAALETLAVIAYRQPVSTPEIEKIRGVECGGVLRTLLERSIISIVGRSDRPGRPLLYGTTQQFLYYFGLNDLRELPRVEELEKLLGKPSEAGQLAVDQGLTADEEVPQSGSAPEMTAEDESQQVGVPAGQPVSAETTGIPGPPGETDHDLEIIPTAEKVLTSAVD